MSVLRDIFGPSKQEVWAQLCSEINADLVDNGFWKGSRVEARTGEWTIVLDTYTVSNGKTSSTYTRMRAPYINPDGFRFRIYRAGVFSELGKFLGGQDIEVGYTGFDENFIIKGNDEEKVRKLFSNEKIRELIELQPSIHFEVKDNEGLFGMGFPENVDELYFSVGGVIRDVDRLKNLYYLFSEVLNELCILGSAYKNAPDVQL